MTPIPDPPTQTRPLGRIPRLLLATRTGRLGGAERMVVEIARGIRESGALQVDLTSTPLPWEIQEDRLPEPGAEASLRLLVAGNYDVIHTHLFLPGLLARLRRMWDGSFRWVHTVHYHDYRGLRLPGVRAWLDRRFVLPGADTVVFVGAPSQAGFGHLANGQTVENAMDLSPAPGSPAGNPPLVGCVSMLRTEKGLDRFVQAAAILQERGVQFRMEIAGDGPQREQLTTMIHELGLEHRVILRGYQDDLVPFYRGLTAYVQPSRSEAFGLAALEAFRFGVPVVATAVGHLPTLLGHGRFGRLVDPEGAVPEQLAEAIYEALEARAEWSKRSREGREHWAPRVDPARYRESHRRIYAHLLLPRVCTVAALATHGGGGIPRQVLLQTRALAASGHRMFLLQRHDPDADLTAPDSPWRHLTLLQTPALPVLGDSSPGVRLRGLLSTVLQAWTLWWHRHRYDLVHTHQLFSPTLAALLAKPFTGKPVAVKVTSSGQGVGELNELRRLPLRRLRMWAFRGIDAFIALTPSMGRELAEAGFPEDRIHVIPNAVEIPDPIAAPSNSTLQVLFTGRLSTEKSLETLLEATALLRDRQIQIDVHLVGGPAPDRNAEPGLRDLSRTLEVQDRVTFHGAVPSVSAFLASAHVFVLPSVNEGMSNALLEAMAAGRASVVSDIPQNRALVRDGEEGLLFRQGDAAHLAAGLERLAHDLAAGGALLAEMGAAARSRVASHHAPEVVGARLSRLFQTLERAPSLSSEAP